MKVDTGKRLAYALPAGPDLRICGQKLDSEWVRGFAQAPREKGNEADAVAGYLAARGKHKPGPTSLPEPGSFVQARLDEGQQLFMLRRSCGGWSGAPRRGRQSPPGGCPGCHATLRGA